jgi:MHS family proline/betaine transporter-like MFS transporter
MKSKKLNFSVIAGNLLEWYEFSLYGYMASIFAKVFFPAEKSLSGLMIVFAAYAVSFSMRPIGGLIIGYLGDYYGRKKVLLISILALTALTIGIGILPSFASIGILAPIFLIILRLMQGAFIGSEYVGANVYQAEMNVHRPGFYAAFVQSSTFVGALLASLSVLFLSFIFSQESILNGAWRIPYFLAGVFAIIIFFMRLKLPNIKKESDKKSLLNCWKAIFKNEKIKLLQAILIPAAGTAAVYYFIYQLSYLATFLHFSLAASLMIMVASKLILFISLPFFAHYGDLIGHRKFLIGSLIVLMISAYPVFHLMTQPVILDLFIGQILFALLVSPYLSLNMTYVTMLFSPENRLTASTSTINLSIAIFGASTPLISLFLVKITHISIMPMIYFLVTCLLSLGAIVTS